MVDIISPDKKKQQVMLCLQEAQKELVNGMKHLTGIHPAMQNTTQFQDIQKVELKVRQIINATSGMKVS